MNLQKARFSLLQIADYSYVNEYA